MHQHQVYRFDEFEVDPESWSLFRDGKEVHLEPVVLELLIYLIAHRDRLVTRQELMDTVWGDTVISEAALSKAVARLRKALGDDSATHRYLETVYSRGYRFVADVEETVAGEDHDTKPRQERALNRRRGWFAGAAVLIVLTLLGVVWLKGPGQDVPQTDDIVSLAVLPLRNLTGNPEQDFYADGIQDILITELSKNRALRITSRQSTRRYRDSQLPATDIARELGVDLLVEGSLLRAGSNIELTIQLLDGRSDEHLWAERFARQTRYVFDLVADAARAVGAAIDPTAALPGPEQLAGARPGPVDPRAIDAYSLALTHLDRFTRDGIELAIDQLQQAVVIEPEFALAWGELAVAYAMLSLHGYAPPRESIEKARAAALQAIEADERFYIGHSTLGWVRIWTGDLQGACESFTEALWLNPSAPYAIHGDADCLMFDGRMEESVARTRELLMVAPFSAMHNRPLPYHLFLARRYEESISACSAMQARVKGFSVHGFMALVYWAEGRLDKALQEERLELEWRGDAAMLATLEEGLRAAGPAGAMRAMAEALVARSNDSYVDPFRIGETFARAGMVDEALYWLDKAADYGSYELTYVALRPDFDLLRDDPRYPELIERVYGQNVPEVVE